MRRSIKIVARVHLHIILKTHKILYQIDLIILNSLVSHQFVSRSLPTTFSSSLKAIDLPLHTPS